MIHLIINPIAGRTKAQRALLETEKILVQRGVPYMVHVTQHKSHATEIACELSHTPNSDIIVVGGDGTLNDVLQGIDNFDNVRLGLIPCGTGNDFARVPPIPKDVKKAVDIILNDHTEYIDYIQVADGRRAINVTGAGMDVDTLVKYSEIKKIKGKLKYYWALLCVLAKLKFHKVRLVLDDKDIERTVFMVAIANGRYIGGGMPISPLSELSDGQLNVVVINEMKRSRVFPMLLKFLKGKHMGKAGVEHYYCKRAYLEVLDDGRTEVDGEVSQNRILDCEIVSNRLKMFCLRK